MTQKKNMDDIRKTLIGYEKSIHLLAEEEKLEEKQFREDVTKHLQAIEKNTSDLSEIVTLIKTSNENQEITIDLLRDILGIASASNKQEADSKLQSVINQINRALENIDTINKLIYYAMIVYKLVISFYN